MLLSAAAAVPAARNRLRKIRSAASGPLLTRSCAVVGTLNLSLTLAADMGGGRSKTTGRPCGQVR
jgi:hypothetical protein